MPNFSVTLSSVGTSAVCNLDWIGGKPTTISVTGSCSSQTADFIIQYTLDDVQRVASTSVGWVGVSSAFGSLAQHWNGGTVYPDGVTIGLLSPVAAVRLNSSAFTNGTLTLKVIQGVGG